MNQIENISHTLSHFQHMYHILATNIHLLTDFKEKEVVLLKYLCTTHS